MFPKEFLKKAGSSGVNTSKDSGKKGKGKKGSSQRKSEKGNE